MDYRQVRLEQVSNQLVRGLAKWRRKTVDFVDALCIEVTEALSASTAAQAPVEEKKEEKKETKALVNSGTTVIAPKTQVTVETPKPPLQHRLRLRLPPRRKQMYRLHQAPIKR